MSHTKRESFRLSFLCAGSHMEVCCFTACGPRGGEGKSSQPDLDFILSL